MYWCWFTETVLIDSIEARNPKASGFNYKLILDKAKYVLSSLPVLLYFPFFWLLSNFSWWLSRFSILLKCVLPPALLNSPSPWTSDSKYPWKVLYVWKVSFWTTNMDNPFWLNIEKIQFTSEAEQRGKSIEKGRESGLGQGWIQELNLYLPVGWQSNNDWNLRVLLLGCTLAGHWNWECSQVLNWGTRKQMQVGQLTFYSPTQKSGKAYFNILE